MITLHEAFFGDLTESLRQETIRCDQCWMDRPWSEKGWREQTDERVILGLGLDDKIIAMSSWHPVEENKIEIDKFCVSPRCRGTGLAIHFFKETYGLKISQQNSVLLEVDSRNTRALKFYQKIKGQVIAERKSFYSDGAQALTIMWNPAPMKNDPEC